jgi:hypothetical protein
VSLIVLCSATGAPGVTTTVLALGWVWPLVLAGRRVLVVDADVAGSGILPGYLQAGVPAGGGVLGLAAERAPITPGAMLEHCVALDPSEDRLVLTGITDPAQARALWPVWSGLVDVARDLGVAGVDVLVDLGRLGHRHEPTVLLEQADVVGLVLGSTLASVSGAVSGLRALREARGPGPSTGAVVVGQPDPYTPGEIARELHLEHLPVVAHDTWAAGVLSTGGGLGWRFERSALLRSARGLATDLRAGVDVLVPGAGS